MNTLKALSSRLITGPNAPWRYRYNCWYRWLFAPLGRLIAWIAKWTLVPLFRPLWKKTENVRASVMKPLGKCRAKCMMLRKIFAWLLWGIGQLIRWIVNLLLVLIVVILLGGTGFLVKQIVVPVANHYGVPLSIGEFNFYPLKGYLQIKDFRVDNPQTFLEKDEVYTENPLLAFSHFEVDFDMNTLFSGDEYVVENLELCGLRVLYAFDCDTTNVDALIAQITGPSEPAPESAPEAQPEQTPAAEPAPESQPAPEPQPQAAPEADTPATEQKSLRMRIAHFKIEDNWVSLRNGNLYVPLAISLPLPPMELNNITNYELKEWIDSVVDKFIYACEVIESGVDKAWELIGNGFGAGVAALGDFANASLKVLGDIGAATADFAKSAGTVVVDGAAAVGEGAMEIMGGVGSSLSDGAAAVGDIFSGGASAVEGLFSFGGKETPSETEAPKK